MWADWRFIGPIVVWIALLLFLQAVTIFMKNREPKTLGEDAMYFSTKQMFRFGGVLLLCAIIQIYIELNLMIGGRNISTRSCMHTLLGLIWLAIAVIFIRAWACYRVQIGPDELAVRGLWRGWERGRWGEIRGFRVQRFLSFGARILVVEAGGKSIEVWETLLGSKELFDDIVEEVRLRSVW